MGRNESSLIVRQRSKLLIPALVMWLAVQCLPQAAPAQAGSKSSTAPKESPSLDSKAASSSQQPDSGNLYTADLEAAWKLYQLGKTADAEAGFRRLIASSNDSHDCLVGGEAHRGLAAVNDRRANFSAARAEAETALAMCASQKDSEQLAHAQEWVGIAAHEMGDNKTAQNLYAQALKIYEQRGLTRQRANLLLDMCYAIEGYAERTRIARQAFELAGQAGSRSIQGRALHGIGEWQFIQGNSDEAEKTLREAESFLTSPEDAGSLGRVKLTEGRLFRAHGENDRALETFHEALKLAEESGDVQAQLQLMNGIAAVYGDQKKPREALAIFENALKLAQKANSPRIVGVLRQNIAEAHINLGEPQIGADMIEEMNRQNPDPFPYGAQYRYATLALAYQKLGKHEAALAAATRAVDEARSHKNGQFINEPLMLKAHSEEKLGRQKEALADAHEALKSIEELRAHLVPSDFMKRGFGEKTQEAFAYAIQLHESIGEENQAVAVAEQARARAFLDLLASHEIALRRPPGGTAGANGGTEIAANIPESAAAVATRGARPKTGDAARPEPELPSQVSVESASLEEIKSQAHRLNSTVLSYWVADEETFVWVMDPSGELHSAVIKITRERLTEMVRAVWPVPSESVSPSLIAQKGGEPSHKAAKPKEVLFPARGEKQLTTSPRQMDRWRELYQLVIGPVEAYLPSQPAARVTIIPHGPLFGLAFAGLRDAHNRYFLERYTLQYVPAISVFRFTAEAAVPGPDKPHSVLLLADPSGMKQLGLPQLPGARREVAEIAARFPSNQVSVLTGSAALKDSIRSAAAQSDIIHLATHGLVEDDKPFDSFLALADGKLTARDLYSWNLHADLVFLSACRSGLGKFTGDGVLGLTRSFLYAGSRTVVATLWDVADEPTALLVSSFYGNLNSGHDKAQSLRSAQLSVLQRLRAGRIQVKSPDGPLTLSENPVFWASFVVIGEP